MAKKIIKELQGFKEELQKFDSIEVKGKRYRNIRKCDRRVGII
ncbi:hypothetical protein JUM001_03660 [Clostridium perfringens]|nr:hypothetical protein [Clostridium perfringens]BDS16132.1 hypothetical protein JUM001_03660 [Clostridium perfringens]